MYNQLVPTTTIVHPHAIHSYADQANNTNNASTTGHVNPGNTLFIPPSNITPSLPMDTSGFSISLGSISFVGGAAAGSNGHLQQLPMSLTQASQLLLLQQQQQQQQDKSEYPVSYDGSQIKDPKDTNRLASSNCDSQLASEAEKLNVVSQGQIQSFAGRDNNDKVKNGLQDGGGERSTTTSTSSNISVSVGNTDDSSFVHNALRNANAIVHPASAQQSPILQQQQLLQLPLTSFPQSNLALQQYPGLQFLEQPLLQQSINQPVNNNNNNGFGLCNLIGGIVRGQQRYSTASTQVSQTVESTYPTVSRSSVPPIALQGRRERPVRFAPYPISGARDVPWSSILPDTGADSSGLNSGTTTSTDSTDASSRAVTTTTTTTASSRANGNNRNTEDKPLKIKCKVPSCTRTFTSQGLLKSHM
ncbi:hypothetical protein BGZ65_010385, partial [Modicella reniformis]